MKEAKTNEEIFTFEPPMADISWVKRKFLDIPYGESKAQAIDIYLPDEGEGPFPLVLHIHGGGFAFGDKRDDHMNAYLTGIKEGFAVASVAYAFGVNFAIVRSISDETLVSGNYKDFDFNLSDACGKAAELCKKIIMRY